MKADNKDSFSGSWGLSFVAFHRQGYTSALKVRVSIPYGIHSRQGELTMEIRYCDNCGNPIQVELGQLFSTMDRVVCDACRPGAKKDCGDLDARNSGAKLDDILESSNLNLFSSQTIVLHKQKLEQGSAPAEKPKSAKLKLVKPGSASSATGAGSGIRPPQARPPQSPSSALVASQGASNPSKSAQKIVFRCMHCHSTLSIRPIEKTSKLTCPHCAKDVFITISGRVLKMSPSIALKKESQPGSNAPASIASTSTPQPVWEPAHRSGSGRVPIVEPTPRTEPAKTPTLSAGQPGSGSVVVVKPGSARLVKSASSRVLKSSRNSQGKPQTATAPAKVPSARIQSDRIGTARLAAQAPSTPPVRQPSSTSPQPLAECPSTFHPEKPPSTRALQVPSKPCSAFEEHQARQDPEKTVFITEEPTSDLSALANIDTIRNFCKESPIVPSAPRTQASPGPLLPDASDLLDIDASTPDVKSGGSSSMAKAGDSEPPGKGIAKRVLKALFSP